MSNSLAPADVLRDVEQQKIRDFQAEEREKERLRKVIEASVKAEHEREYLQKFIYDNANPSPIFITIIIVSILFAIYILYVMFVKPCMSGEWVDAAGNTWKITHSKFGNSFRVKINGVCGGGGKVYDNFVRYGDLVGVWNYGSIISFTEGWSLERIE